MIDGLLGRLVVASVDRRLKVADVEEVGRRVVDKTTDLSRGRTRLVELIKLVVEEEHGHGFVNNPALMRVCVADVRSSTDDGGVLLVGGIVYDQGVFVVAETQLPTEVLLMRALVYHTFCVMDVALDSCIQVSTLSQIPRWAVAYRYSLERWGCLGLTRRP